MDPAEEEKLFFETLDNLKKPEWFRSVFFGNSRILASRIPGRLAPFLLTIQDNPDFFLEFCQKIRVVRLPVSWFQVAAESGQVQTVRALLNFQVWTPEELVSILSSSKPLKPEILSCLLSSPHLVWTPFAVASLFLQGNLENQKQMAQDPRFQACLQELQEKGLFDFLKNQVCRLFGNQEGSQILQKQKEIVRKYAIAQENLELFLRPKL